eukprot:3201087-Prorocentrum_lima.AAC.1
MWAPREIETDFAIGWANLPVGEFPDIPPDEYFATQPEFGLQPKTLEMREDRPGLYTPDPPPTIPHRD